MVTPQLIPRDLGKREMTTNELLVHRINELESGMANLEKKLDRLTWALVSLSVSLMTAAISLAIAVTVTR